MEFFRILRSLIDGEFIILLIIAMAVTFFIGFKMKTLKKNITAIIVNVCLYVVCEFLHYFNRPNIYFDSSQFCATPYFDDISFTELLIGFLSLVIGTIAVGGVIGFSISALIPKDEKSVPRKKAAVQDTSQSSTEAEK